MDRCMVLLAGASFARNKAGYDDLSNSRRGTAGPPQGSWTEVDGPSDLPKGLRVNTLYAKVGRRALIIRNEQVCGQKATVSHQTRRLPEISCTTFNLLMVSPLTTYLQREAGRVRDKGIKTKTNTHNLQDRLDQAALVPVINSAPITPPGAVFTPAAPS